MTRIALALTLLILLLAVRPAAAQDAALVAQTLTGDARTVEAVSFELARATERRLWVDLFGVSELVSLDLANAGVGLSVDITPREDWCGGVGYYVGGMIYAGRHINF